MTLTSLPRPSNRKAFKPHPELPQIPSHHWTTSLDMKPTESSTVGHTFSESLALSNEACWNDILTMEYQWVSQLDVPSMVHQEPTLIYYCTPTPAAIEYRVNGQYSHHVLQPNDLSLFAKGATTWARSQTAIEFLVLTINPIFIDRIAHELMPVNPVELKNLLAFQDMQLQYLLLTLKTELEDGCSAGRLFGESLAAALAVQLLQKYATTPPTLYEYNGGLPKHKLKKAIAYIHEHLSDDVSLEAIAAEVGMTQYHFARLFKQSIGIAPHKYLIQQRIEMSKVLLKQKEVAIADIASECGFADHSHFTKLFRQQTGISPKSYRQQ